MFHVLQAMLVVAGLFGLVAAPFVGVMLILLVTGASSGLIVGLGFVAMLAAVIIHTFNYQRDFYIPADEVVRTETARTRLMESHV